jgi:serine/threonine protein phosphatase PrpC
MKRLRIPARDASPGPLPEGRTQHRRQDRTRDRTQDRTQDRPGSARSAGSTDRDVSGWSEVLELDIGQFSDPGRKRPNNEDWLGTFQPEDAGRLNRRGCLFLLADGMGGHQSGEMASRQAVDRAIRAYMEDQDLDAAASLRRAFETANAALYDSASTLHQGQNSGTTLVAGVIRRGELWVANVGDSRAYLLHHGELKQISEDHSWAAVGSRAGLGEEWVGRHVLMRALGTRPHVEVDVYGPLPLAVGDRLILCSDGLTTILADAEIREIADRHPSQKASEALVQAANERGGPDNVSVLMVEVQGPGQQGRASGQALANGGQRLLQKVLPWADWERLLAPSGGHLYPALIAAAILAAMLLLGLGFSLGLLLRGH